MTSEQAAELSDAQVAALPNRAEEIVGALPEPTPPAAPEPGTPLPPGDPGITPEEGSAIRSMEKNHPRNPRRHLKPHLLLSPLTPTLPGGTRAPYT